MAVRDRLAAMVLAAGLLAGIAGWRFVGPWAGITLVMAAMVVAAAVYRVEKARAEAKRLSRPRPAAAPPSRSARGS